VAYVPVSVVAGVSVYVNGATIVVELICVVVLSRRDTPLRNVELGKPDSLILWLPTGRPLIVLIEFTAFRVITLLEME
jgi:hypothetical protein